MAAICFITGTDTGVGKTVVTALLTRYLREQGVRVRAVKPFCSGGRADARWLSAAHGGAVALDELNPWHFRAPLAPVLAARLERRSVKLAETLAWLRAAAQSCAVLLVEGAGGLLSPLGEGFDARDLIQHLRTQVIVVAPNRLGVVNQVRLVLAALPETRADQARVALIAPMRPDRAARTNPGLLAEYVPAPRITCFPRVVWPEVLRQARLPLAVRRAFRAWKLRTDSPG